MASRDVPDVATGGASRQDTDVAVPVGQAQILIWIDTRFAGMCANADECDPERQMSGNDDIITGSAHIDAEDSRRTQMPPASGPAVDPPPAEAGRMPASRSQIVFGQRGEIEMFVWTGEHTRRIRISMTHVPFSILAMSDARVRSALEHWVKSTPGQVWITWTGIRSALAAQAVDIAQLAEEYPPN